MSSRTALAAVIVAIALVVAVAPVVLAPAGDQAFADVAANLRPGDAPADAATPDPAPPRRRRHRRADAAPGTGAAAPAPAVAADARTRRAPAFRSPVGGTNGRTVRLNLAGPRDYVAQTNFVQCVGASVQMMLNIIKPGADRTAAYQHRLQAWRGR